MAKMEYTEHEAKEIERDEWSKVDRERAKVLFKEVQLIRETVIDMEKVQAETVVVLREISTQLKKTNKTLAAILSARSTEVDGVH
jgi:hypothetical protein